MASGYHIGHQTAGTLVPSGNGHPTSLWPGTYAPPWALNAPPPPAHQKKKDNAAPMPEGCALLLQREIIFLGLVGLFFFIIKTLFFRAVLSSQQN